MPVTRSEFSPADSVNVLMEAGQKKDAAVAREVLTMTEL